MNLIKFLSYLFILNCGYIVDGLLEIDMHSDRILINRTISCLYKAYIICKEELLAKFYKFFISRFLTS